MNGIELIGALLDDDDDDDIGAIGEDYDLIGDDDDENALLEALAISGAGDTEIIGARPKVKSATAAQKRRAALARKQALAKQALAKLAQRNAGAVVKRNLKNRRRFPIGFIPTNVGAGVTVLIPAAPQNLFRPERIIIPSDIAFDFGVVNINVGNTSQLVQAVEVPAAMFSEVAVDTNITFDTAEVGNQLSLQVRNKALIQIQFTAAALGTVAKP